MIGDRRKSDYLEKNTNVSICDDGYLYRIFNVDHLVRDLIDERITLVHPCEATQGDELENHLLESKFKIDGEDHTAFKAIMKNYFAQSWSRKPLNGWEAYGDGSNNIRVKCKASVLLDRLMNTADKFYSLSYYLWEISYEDSTAIRDRMDGGNFEDYMDSTGIRLLKTVMTLDSDFSDEEEVRLLYVRRVQEDNLFPRINVLSGNDEEYCSHVFDWRGVIESFTFSPHNVQRCPRLLKLLAEYHSMCREDAEEDA